MEITRKKYGMDPRLVELNGAEAVQEAPCAFGTFCILYNGEVISYHPISGTRFENIMEKIGSVETFLNLSCRLDYSNS